jgi:EAL domain-containing protein (putative c-di-GMP-specific phosphodiesterase class I)
MARNPVHRAIVLAIHQVARAIGVATVAEFVEDADVLDALRTIGVDYAQGYAIHRPEPMLDPSVPDEAQWYAAAL